MAAKFVTIPTAKTVGEIALAQDVIGFSTLGYHRLGDGGGGVYERAAGEAGPGDLVTKNNIVFALREPRPNAKQFGAVGDGATDDSAALSLAITAGIAVGALHLPPGRYVARGLEVSGALVLTGENATLVCPEAGGEAADLLKIARGGCEIRHLRFEGAVYSGPGDAIGATLLRISDPAPRVERLTISECDFVGGLNGCVIGSADDVLVERVRFIQQKGVGLTLHRGPSRSIVRGVTARGCGGAGIAGQHKTTKRPTDRLILSDFIVEDCGHLGKDAKRWQAGVELAASAANDWVVSNGTISGCQGGALEFRAGPDVTQSQESVENLVITNLSIQQPGNAPAIRLNWLGVKAAAPKLPSRILVANNIIRYQGADSRTASAFALAAFGEVQVSGNLVDGAGVGVRIRAVGSDDDTLRGLAIKGNRFTNVMVGIEATSDGAIEDLRITGNEIRAGRNGVLFDGAPVTRAQIDHNQIEQVERLSNLETFAALTLTNAQEVLILSNRIDALGGSALVVPETSGPASGGSLAYNVVTAAYVPFRFGAGRWQLAMNDVSATSDDGSYVATGGAVVYATFTLRGIAQRKPDAFGARGDLWIGHAAAGQEPMGWVSDGNSQDWTPIDIEMGPPR
ncbi:MAG: glycosyl hydrolase family 28-related protein [Pseudomonadota bacterium]